MIGLKRPAHRLGLIALFAVLLLATTPGYCVNRCLDCHQDVADKMASVTQFPHAALACTGCHQDAVLDASEEHAEKLKPVQCQRCHKRAEAAYQKSVHGRKALAGDKLAATCVDCHGHHSIRRVNDPRSRVYPLNLPATCGHCHNQQTMAGRHDIAVPNAYRTYLKSVHGQGLLKAGLLVSASCKDCHGYHDIQRVSDPRSPLSRDNVVYTCGRCHKGVEETYRRSIHGKLWAKGDSHAPVCTTCHSTHTIMPTNEVAFKLSSLGGCGSCHKKQSSTYRDTYHGQITELGYVAVAKCYDCHGYHDVLPPSNPKSSVNPRRLVTTCRKCHPKANSNFVKYYCHGDDHDSKNYPVLFYTYLFMTLLLIAVFTSFGVHTVLWLYRSLKESVKSRNGADDTAEGEGGSVQ